MKRYRAVDVPPKFRRTAKGGRNTRLGDSVYFSRFFSAYNLVYLKFFLMWVCCIALDFLIGFRFELLWPVWLLARHLYESFRVHAISSSLHYSAFSVFFVCVTATSDLVCYLFIPIQVLIFLASTYVWVQFVYQSSDRGVCLPSLFLWALFIVFEYSVRYRFDNATWYLTRTSWITAGLFPSTADSVSIGLSANSSSSSPSSTRLELYRPFAAHSIGFPVVTLGFRVKSFFSNWRLRVRREEVMRQNEFFERLLAEAIPTSFDNRKHFISSRSHLSIDQQEALACIHSKPTTEQHNGPMNIYRDTMAISGTGNALYQNSNGRTVGLNSSSGSSPTVLQQHQRQFSSISQQKTLMQPPLSVCSSTFNSTLEQLLHATQNMSYSLSPFDSNGGTNGAEHGGITYNNANGMLNNNSNSGSSTCSGATSKKSRRSRVVSSISQTSTVPVVAADASSSISLSTPGVSTLYNSNNANIKLGDADLNNEFCGGVNNLLQHQQHEGGDNNNNSECSLLRENAQRLSEIRQLQKERQTLELSFDKIKSELKNARSTEHELRLQLSSVQQREQCCREEWKQFERDQKQRVDQLESKCKQLSKQNDYYKLNTQALERRVGELQLKKSEIERELTNERLRNSARDEPVGKPQHNATSDNGEFKQKLASQDRELKALRKESKAKTEQSTKFEEELRQLRTAKSDGSKQMEIMRQKNFLLEQTLSSENKLKQDLFRALNDSKAEIATLKARLHSKQINEQQGGAMNNYRDTMATSGTGNALYQNSNGGGRIVGLNSSSGSSPTVLQQQQRQFSSISQQKSLTPPPLSVGSSTFNSTLEQLLQATQNMSYSLSPLDSNGGTNGAEHGGITYNNANGMLNNNVNSGSSTFSGVTTSDMLAVGGHRSVGGNTNAGAAVKDGSSGNN